MKDTNRIRFRLGEETRHVIETLDDKLIETSMFSDQYKKAIHCLETILRQRIHESCEEDNAYNNIISFIGDRGSGKTSCMLSFSNLLSGDLSTEIKSAYPLVAENKFHCIKRIDPSFFDKTHNVIELFLASLYNDFALSREKRTPNVEIDHKERIVIELFAEAQKKMSEMTKAQDDDYDVLEKLHNLSAGIKLGEVIKELVQAFMAYIELEGGVLVIQIDDIDLNSSLAAEMMEQIRKFLIQPNIVILLAAKLDQLSAAKEIQLREEYSSIPDTEMQDFEFEDMVDAYLTKLLPHQQRVYMPDGTAYFNQPVEVIRESGEVDSYPSIRQMVPELIFKKTRYLFYNSSDKTSFIVPDNLRDLRFLVSLLYSMQDYWRNPEEDKHRQSNRYNKLLFRKYLFENWASNNLDYSMRRQMQRILGIQDTEQINAAVIACIKSTFSNSNESIQMRPKLRTMQSEVEVDLIYDTNNYNYNIAAGDVLGVIDSLENSETDIQKLHFLFLLRSFYSMRLYQSYDIVTGDGEISNDTVFAPSKLNQMSLNEYDKQVAGYHINTRLSRLVPRGAAIKDTRDERPIVFSELSRLIQEVIVEKGSDVKKLRIVEFFMLGISRRYDTKDVLRGSQYRKSDAVFYAEPLDQLVKNAYFDVGALLFNLSHIENCYKRFRQGADIYSIAEKENSSLLNLFRLESIKEKAKEGTPCIIENYKESYWLSWCCFRNAEIIKAFKEHMSSYESPGGSVSNILSKAFIRMSDFKIPTYDKDEEGNYYYINFKYLSIMGRLLLEPEIQEDFNKVFLREDRPEPEKIDLRVAIRGASIEHNKKTTRIRNLNSLYPNIERYYQDEVHAIFDEYGDYMSKDEISRAVARLDDELKNFRKE